MIVSTPLRGLVATAILGALAFSVASPSNAFEGAETREITVHYADLNVSTSLGAAALYARIRGAAEALCSPLDHGDLASKMHRIACANQSIAQAVSKVNQGTLFAVYNAKNARALPTIVAAEQAR